VELKLKSMGEFSNKLLIGVSFRTANLMMKMGDGKHYPQFFPQFKQQPQQSHRIGAA